MKKSVKNGCNRRKKLNDERRSIKNPQLLLHVELESRIVEEENAQLRMKRPDPDGLFTPAAVVRFYRFGGVVFPLSVNLHTLSIM